MNDFEAYIRQGKPGRREKAANWDKLGVNANKPNLLVKNYIK